MAAGTPIYRTEADRPERRVMIDLLRFVGCFAIAVWHYQHFRVGADAAVGFHVAQQPFYDWLSLFYEHGGRYRVQAFWCISGFVLFLIYGRAIAGGTITPRTFFLNRLARLYPLYIVSLALVAALQAVYTAQQGRYFIYPADDPWFAVLNLFLATDWLSHSGSTFNGPVWSLSVLIPVYALFVWIVRQYNQSIIVNVAVVAVTSLLHQAFDSYRVLECAAHFFAGGIGAIVLLRYGDTRLGPALRLAAALTLAGVVIVGQTWGTAALFPLLHLVLLFVLPTMCFLAASVRRLPAGISAILRWLGDLSFGIFLLHFPVQLVIAIGFGWMERPIPIQSPLLFAAYFALTIAVAHLSFVTFETPMQHRLRRAFGIMRAAG